MTLATDFAAYGSFRAMHKRTKTDPNYKKINVCKRWSGKDGFKNFIKDMGERPEGHSIERVNNNHGYTPKNCIWATRLEQAQNQRHTVHVTLDGETHSISEWCRIRDVSYDTFKRRRRRGMTIEQALVAPSKKLNQETCYHETA